MGERTHTPGPWRSTLDEFGDYTIQPQNSELAIAAVVNGSFKNLIGEGEEQAANARLIASAPDMFEALRGMIDLVEVLTAPRYDNETLRDARAALSKATGGQHV